MKNTLSIFLLLFHCFSVFAQNSTSSPSLYFNRIGIDNGLSFGNVNCLLEDSKGFIWIGTSNGLNRYDGNVFTVYRHRRGDSLSLIGNDVRSLEEDANGNIWIGTTEGVSSLNPFREKFTNYQHREADSNSLHQDYINYVFTDRNRTIWCGSASGLDTYDDGITGFHHIALRSPSGKSISVTAFCEDDSDNFWIGTNDGLILFNSKTGQQQYFKPLLSHSFLVKSLYKDALGNLWAGTWADGAWRFEPNAEKFTQYVFNFTSAYTSATNIVLAIGETQKDENNFSLWFGTTEGLIEMVVKNKNYPVSFSGLPFHKNDQENLHSISSNNITGLLKDTNGILWIGTGNGISKVIPGAQAFTLIHAVGNVTKVMTEKNDLWITTWYGHGLTKLDAHGDEIMHFDRVPPQSISLDNNQVSGVCRDSAGLLWLATFNGLVSYDEPQKKFKQYLHHPPDTTSICDNRITVVFNDSKNRLWVGTYNNGLDRKILGTAAFAHYRSSKRDSTSICDNKIWMITEDHQHRIWIGTNYGLACYEESSNSFINFLISETDGATITGIFDDRKNRLWVSTLKGFYRWNTATDNFEAVVNPSELNDLNVYSILDDAAGNIWLTSQKGLIRYNPETQSILLFDKSDGLPFDDLTGSFDKGDDERFYIGGQHKVIAFNPSALNMPISLPEPVITSLKIFDTPFPLAYFLKSMLPLTLSYNQNMLTLQFTAPNFIHNNSMRFSYWMEGLDKNWNVSGAGRMASYSNMRPGNYIFHVKASAINGQWSNHEAKLNIIIAPPFWETWWFRLTAVFSLIALIVLIIYFMVSRIRKREAEKTAFNTQLAEVEMKALRAQMNPHFLFNALNSIQECVVTNQNDAAYNYLSKFSRLVRLILENSEQTMVIVKKEMDALKLYLDLESLRFQNFTYTITIDKSIDQDVEQIPSMLIQPFAENALKHGLATKQGSRFLKILLLKDKNMLHCTVEDNGIGRRQAEVLKSAMQKDHASRGMQITEERIRLIGSKTKMDVQLNISDLYDEEHYPAGTRVDITIPHENDTA